MRVLACDPGYDRLGIAVLEKDRNGEQLVFSTCITTDASGALADRYTMLGHAVRDLLTTHMPDYVAIESLFFSKNARTAMAVAEMRGVLLYVARSHPCAIVEYTPQEIKVAVTGYGKSSKQQVTDMVRRLLPSAPERALDDEYDAIAIGLTALASLREA